MRAGDQRDPLNLHTHVTHFMNILAAALAELYIMILACSILLYATHITWEPVEIHNLSGFAFAFFLTWICGLSIGYLFNALIPFAPRFFRLIQLAYTRSNMIFSGKMTLGNTIPATILPYFLWNPLFHIIDYSRGESFVNYTPRYTNIDYPIFFSMTVFVLAMVLQKYADLNVSESWSKRQ